jgi:lysophospholipase L1-like esterase
MAVSLLIASLLVALTSCVTPTRRVSDGGAWVGSWATALYARPNANHLFAADTTLRQIVHVSVGGSALRIALSNEFGTADLQIGGVAVALPMPATKSEPETAFDSGLRPSGAVVPRSITAVRFGGRLRFAIPPGAMLVSDPIPMRVMPLSDLAVTLYLPGQSIDVISYHDWADQTNFEMTGNHLDVVEVPGAKQLRSWRFLKGVYVQGAATGAVVAFGDSITDGAPSKLNANHRYPDVLAARLQASPATAHLGVLNAGIGGNSVLHDSGFTGPNALARFDRDVIAQPGVRYVIILEGINDIGRLQAPKAPGETITAEDLIAGYRQLIERAHLHGIRVYGATLTPYQGAHSDTEVGQQVREQVNEFIRHGGAFDGVVDFASTTADPVNPRVLAAATGTPDHLHPGDAGYVMMGESIDLALFKH